MFYRLALASVLIVLSASVVRADNFRCPSGSIVSTGDSISTVAVRCGSPSFTARREEPFKNDIGRTVYIEVQEWTYNEGPNKLLHTLIFRNGILGAVTTGGYGS